MALALTVAQIQALAPDMAAVVAARKLATRASWQSLGQSEAAIWGECKGSAVYQTRVALGDWASRCSCPSRKFPCKHALGLMLLAVEGGALASMPEPEWVREWLDKRGAAKEKKQARADAPPKPVDEAAQQKRAAKRHEAILAGLDQLDAWMSDLVRQGLARAQGESPSFWDGAARRLVDAQAAGLAPRVRRMGERVGSGEDWASRLLEELGGLALLTHAYRRVESLDAPLAADVRRLVGWSLDQADVVAHGDVVEDDWCVLADVEEDDERLRSLRTWLVGSASGRVALVAQYAAGQAPFAETLLVGTRMRAKLAFWPSAVPRRALVLERAGAAGPLLEAPRGTTIGDAVARHSAAVARLPWLQRDLFVLSEVVPARVTRRPEGLEVMDAAGASVRLAGVRHAELLAVTGGHPFTLAGEWEDGVLRPLMVWIGGRRTSLGGRRG